MRSGAVTVTRSTPLAAHDRESAGQLCVTIGSGPCPTSGRSWALRILLGIVLVVGVSVILTATTGAARADQPVDVPRSGAAGVGLDAPGVALGSPAKSPVVLPSNPAPALPVTLPVVRPEKVPPDAAPVVPVVGSGNPVVVKPAPPAPEAPPAATPEVPTSEQVAPEPSTEPVLVAPAAAPTRLAAADAPATSTCLHTCPESQAGAGAGDQPRSSSSATAHRLPAEPALPAEAPPPVADPSHPAAPLQPTPAPGPPPAPLAPSPPPPPTPAMSGSASVSSAGNEAGPGPELAVLGNAAVLTLAQGSVGTTSGPRDHVAIDTDQPGDRPD